MDKPLDLVIDTEESILCILSGMCAASGSSIIGSQVLHINHRLESEYLQY